MSDKKDGVSRITAERKRQILDLGWTPEHDDGHANGSLAMAACCYAAPRYLLQKNEQDGRVWFDDPWPWNNHWDKRYACGKQKHNPSFVPPNPDTYSADERIDLLTKAGALIAAEIDRLLRVAAKSQIENPKSQITE